MAGNVNSTIVLRSNSRPCAPRGTVLLLHLLLASHCPCHCHFAVCSGDRLSQPASQEGMRLEQGYTMVISGEGIAFQGQTCHSKSITQISIMATLTCIICTFDCARDIMDNIINYYARSGHAAASIHGRAVAKTNTPHRLQHESLHSQEECNRPI